MKTNRLLLGCLAVVLVGCGTPEQTAATGEATTTSSTPTPTTSAPTTTSTVAATTTPTVPAPEGDALVVSERFVLGWWSDGAWQKDPEYKPLESGEELQFFSVEEDPYSVIGGEPIATCDWISDKAGQTPLVRQVPLELTPAPVLGRMGVSAPWAVESSEVEHIEADQSLVDIAAGLLADVGIDDPNPVFAQVIESDLDGDGRYETVAVLDRDAAILGADDAYGVAFVVYHDGSVQVIGEYGLAELEFSNGIEVEGIERIVAVYRVFALMDVNGDGRVEVAMSSCWWESWADELFAIDSETSQLTRVLGQACGF